MSCAGAHWQVEAVLNAHPEVAQASVFGIPSALMGELVAAAVTLRAQPDGGCMCVYACVCVCVCVCGCGCLAAYMHVYMCVLVCLRTCMSVCSCVCIHVCDCSTVRS